MSEPSKGRPSCDHFYEDLIRLYNRYSAEYDMTCFELVGVVECFKAEVIRLNNGLNDDQN